jgi:phosphoribosyl-ATP pyrophosphohydrolase
MATRHAKNPHDERWQAMPVGLVTPQLPDLAIAQPPSGRPAATETAPAIRQRRRRAAASHELDRLYAALEAVTPESHPRTARLLGSSTRKVAQKVIEEAGEVALAAVKHNRRNVVRESADLLYHLAVLWRRTAIDAQEVWTEMRCRAVAAGIAEKLPKSNGT